MKKRISFRMWIAVVWGGIWQFVKNIFSWKNKTPFWRVIWATITVCILIVTGMLAFSFIEHYASRDSYDYLAQYDPQISPDFKYRNNGKNEGMSYIYDARTKKKAMKDIDWIAIPEDGDSLIIVAKGGKRGFVNRYTAETSIPFRYDAAWSFTDGVAAVCEGDSVYFIDHSGKPINDKKFARNKDYDNYAYHGEYAAIPSDGKYGLIDRKGEWAIEPIYDDIIIGPRNMWTVKENDMWGAINASGEFVIPIENENVWIQREKGITVAKASDHSQSRYDYDGELLDGFIFDDVAEMWYFTDEFDEEGTQKRAIDKLMKYSSNNYYGLMTRGGIPVTPPLYYDIYCVGAGVYQCRLSGYMTDCIMIDGKGEKIN